MNMAPKLARREFVEKIKAKMDAENIGVSQLARKIGVSHPRIIEVVTHGKMPSLDTCIALAGWLKQSEISVLREAGLIPPGPADNVKFDDWKYLLDQLSPEDEAELRQITELKIERRKKEQSLKALKPKKAG